MAPSYTEEFRRDAVRIATTSGLTRPQIASDLGVGLSTLNKWVQKHQHDDLMIAIGTPLVRETMAMPARGCGKGKHPVFARKPVCCARRGKY